MIVLGLNFFFHDSSACILADGQLVAAIEEERLNRDKHTRQFPRLAIAKCLEVAGLELSDVERVAVSIRPSSKRGRKAWYFLRTFPRTRGLLRHETLGAYFRIRTFWSWYVSVWGGRTRGPAVDFVEHHLSHVVGSFLVSPYESAALLGLDGAGEWATSWLGVGRGTDFECYQQSDFPMSLGSLYESVTEFCGFQPNYDEGKTMGLAPMGDASRFLRQAREIATVGRDGGIRIDLDYFRYPYGMKRCGPRFYEVFGAPRAAGEPLQEHHRDVAAAFQQVLEECALSMCRVLRERSGERHLVLSGGVALNSVMNGRILREAGFDDLYVMPAAGDNGTAIGAAFYAHNVLLGHPRTFVHDDPYVGNGYDAAAIEAVLASCKLRAERCADVEARAAALLAEGQILGWFQGRMEFGPRSLGNRSILASPVLPGMKDKINAEVKHREAYRPFAPAVPFEHRKEYFDIEVGAPFMLKVCAVREDRRAVIPAVTHVDGSARVQTVEQRINPRLHRLLEEFGALTGVPVLLNTSFNIMGQPIVESPLDAIRCFFSTGLDCLVLGDYLVVKSAAT